jgi:hypothetical protein
MIFQVFGTARALCQCGLGRRGFCAEKGRVLCTCSKEKTHHGQCTFSHEIRKQLVKWARLIPYAFLLQETFFAFSRLRRVVVQLVLVILRLPRSQCRAGKSRFAFGPENGVYPTCIKVHNLQRASASLTPFGRPGAGSFEIIATVRAEGLWRKARRHCGPNSSDKFSVPENASGWISSVVGPV